MTLSERLDELLQEKYLTAEGLAREIGLTGRAVLKWRKGAAIKLEHLLKVAEYFNCSVDFLCGRTDTEGSFNKAEQKLAQRLKTLIENSKKPIERISKETGLDRRNFYDWLSGKLPVSSSIIALADYFGYTVDYVIGLDG